MDSHQIAQAAYINAQVACAMITAMGMQAENMQRQAVGQSVAYGHSAFVNLIKEYGIHHNATVGSLFSI